MLQNLSRVNEIESISRLRKYFGSICNIPNKVTAFDIISKWTIENVRILNNKNFKYMSVGI